MARTRHATWRATPEQPSKDRFKLKNKVYGLDCLVYKFSDKAEPHAELEGQSELFLSNTSKYLCQNVISSDMHP